MQYRDPSEWQVDICALRTVIDGSQKTQLLFKRNLSTVRRWEFGVPSLVSEEAGTFSFLTQSTLMNVYWMCFIPT
jgi:hypothetical protein